MMYKPNAIAQYRVEKITDFEYLVYNPCSHEAFPVNVLTLRVLEACDGKTDEAALAKKFDLSRETFQEVMARLQAAGLLLSTAMPARRTDLVTSSVGEETVVFDPVSSKAFSLNKTASMVFSRCDGETPQADVSRELGKVAGLEAGEEIVSSTLARLGDQGLLSETRCASTSRRQFLSTGLKAAMIPVVASVLVPMPAAAASICAGGICAGVCAPGTCLACCNPGVCDGSLTCAEFAMTFVGPAGPGNFIITADLFNCYPTPPAVKKFDNCADGCNQLGSIVCCTGGKANLHDGANCQFCGVPQGQLCIDPGSTCCASGPFANLCKKQLGKPCAINSDCCSNNCGGGGLCV